MGGLIGKMKALRGQRDAPIAILLAGERFETHPVGGHGLPA
jgi:hypothetical protein